VFSAQPNSQNGFNPWAAPTGGLAVVVKKKMISSKDSSVLSLPYTNVFLDPLRAKVDFDGTYAKWDPGVEKPILITCSRARVNGWK
jgi:hypothetical protein